MIHEELARVHGCDQIICVSEKEAQEFRQREFTNVRVLGHSLECSPTPNDFASRRGILFVGALDTPNSPNVDSMKWFCREIFPRVRKRVVGGIQFLIAGRISAELKQELSGESVEILGEVAELYDFYNQARVFVAPTRFAGGIPYKVHEAAARGVPIVATQLIESQLGWRDESELLAANDSDGFADACSRLYQDCALWTRLRENALQRIAKDCSPEEFRSRLRAIIG
jgi:glycosyltransferase involved in cell wall biosynthesis